MIKEEEIEVITINEPTKEESVLKIKELCAFLEQTWTLPAKDA